MSESTFTKSNNIFLIQLIVVILILPLEASAEETYRGIVKKNDNRLCPQSDCDKFYLIPDSGYKTTKLKADGWTKLEDYIDKHVELRGYSISCDSCRSVKTFDVNKILVLTDITEQIGEYSIPEKFLLEQNYPNPFNPTTEIAYSLSSEGVVRITVYDIVGREITTIISSSQPPGNYHVFWDASDKANGVYFYRLDICGKNGQIFSQTKAMLLIR